MKPLLILAATGLAVSPALAFPPAPSHEIYGTLRDEGGRPLDSGEGVVILSGTSAEITRNFVDAAIDRGVNYRLGVPMDSATSSQLYQVTALRPALPFTIRVVIRGVNYVPLQMAGRVWTIGSPGGRTRLDLTLGVDSDGDGLPDSWERGLINGDPDGRLTALDEVRPGDDLDGDGLTNLQEYLIGTYALDKIDKLDISIKEVKDGFARLEFATVSGRTYYIKSSGDLATWTDERFALSATVDTQGSLRAGDTSLISIYVPLNGRPNLNFRLHAE